MGVVVWMCIALTLETTLKNYKSLAILEVGDFPYELQEGPVTSIIKVCFSDSICSLFFLMAGHALMQTELLHVFVLFFFILYIYKKKFIYFF